LEIGVETGQSIALARRENARDRYRPRTQDHKSSSLPARAYVPPRATQYFAAHDVRAEFGGLPVDLAFIDGMHQFEFALRDFINIEKHCTSRSTILIHEVLTDPWSRHTAERERRTGFWSGDIWRLVLLLRKYRPDLGV